jgi:hypothetical protein
MELIVYLANGKQERYVQNDPAVVTQMLADLQFGRMFSSSTLVFGSASNCTLVHSQQICRIDLLTDKPVSMPEGLGTRTLIEDEATFRTRALAATLAMQGGVQPGTDYLGYVCVELVGGHRLLMEVEQKLRDQTQLFTNLHRIIEHPVISIPHPRGGAVLVNSKNIVSLSLSPGITEYPKGSWLVEPA